MGFRHVALGSKTILLMTLLGACGSSGKTTLANKDASAERGSSGGDVADSRDAEPATTDLASPSQDGNAGNADRWVTPDAAALDTADGSLADIPTTADAAADVVADRAQPADQVGPAERFDVADARGDLPTATDAPVDGDGPADRAADHPDAARSEVQGLVALDGGGDLLGFDCAGLPGSECMAGQVESRACGETAGACHAGTQARTCTATCLWNAWSACGGTYVGPSPEVCGDGADNDCNGKADEGCACNPVAVGAGASLAVSGTLGKLVADPAACLLYGLTTATPSQLVVFDTANKQEIARVDLGGLATDFDLSPDGAYLVAALDDLKQIAVVDKTSWTVTPVATAFDVRMVEVANSGTVFYFSQHEAEIRGIDLNLGQPSDLIVVRSIVRTLDLELSADGMSLFYGESNLYKVNVTTSPATAADESRWRDGHGFQSPKPHVYLGPSGKHIYYADYQLDAGQLALVVGKSGQVFAEDAAATFAVSAAGIVDAELLTTLATFANPVSAAALTAGDTELWYYSQTTGQLSYANVGDLIAGKALGVREAAASPITDYTLAKLVADPKRPVLFGLDTAKRAVVSIDRQSGLALQSVIVGSRPADLEIDATGTYLYAGHLDTLALAQIDAKNLTFVRFITTPRVTNDIVSLGSDRIATIDEDQWTTPTLIDLVTGKTLAEDLGSAYGGALAATPDGNALFVNDTAGMMTITRYDVSAGKLLQVAQNRDTGGGWGLAVTPDGTSVFNGRFCLDGANLTDIRYPLSATVYSVSPDGKLAISAERVYRVADGAVLATLPVNCAAQALSPDGRLLYCAGKAGIITFPLGGLE